MKPYINPYDTRIFKTDKSRNFSISTLFGGTEVTISTSPGTAENFCRKEAGMGKVVLDHDGFPR